MRAVHPPESPSEGHDSKNQSASKHQSCSLHQLVSWSTHRILAQKGPSELTHALCSHSQMCGKTHAGTIDSVSTGIKVAICETRYTSACSGTWVLHNWSYSFVFCLPLSLRFYLRGATGECNNNRSFSKRCVLGFTQTEAIRAPQFSYDHLLLYPSFSMVASDPKHCHITELVPPTRIRSQG